MGDEIRRPIGETIRECLRQKGWTQTEFAAIIGRHAPEISNLVRGKRTITPDLAVDLATALGETPHFWLDLEARRQLESLPEASDVIARRARVFERAPVRQMRRRGWITDTDDPDVIEKDVLAFFNVPDLADEPLLTLSARKQHPTAPLNREQVAWAFRARQMASKVAVAKYEAEKLKPLEKSLRRFAAYPNEVAKIPRAMAEAGIRFVVVEPLTGGGIDGACFWLDDDAPVIAVSARWDRVDAFWHTLFHELSHVRHKDSWSVDTQIAGSDRAEPVNEVEARADREASASLIDQDDLAGFVHRIQPFFSQARIVQFAHRIKMHPGVIVGQLQHRGNIKYSAHRKLLVKIREHLVPAALADGWNTSFGGPDSETQT